MHERFAESKTDSLLTHDYYKKSWYNTCLQVYSVSVSDLRTIKDDLEIDLTPEGSTLADISQLVATHSYRF